MSLNKVAIVSKLDVSRIKDVLNKYNFKISKDPDFVISYGGDGTILFSERLYPSIPKLIIKKNRICRKYEYMLGDLEKVLRKIKEGDFEIIEEMKLRTVKNGYNLLALNEIQIHHKFPTKAIRFSLQTNGHKFENLIGDGVVVSTPFGSLAYYKVTGGKPFKKGIGISFNNLYNRKEKSFVVDENLEIKIKILREEGFLSEDNNENIIELKEGDTVFIKKAKEKAKIISVNL